MTILVKDERAIFGHLRSPTTGNLSITERVFGLSGSGLETKLKRGGDNRKARDRTRWAPAWRCRSGQAAWAGHRRPHENVRRIKLKIAPAPLPATTASSPPCRAARILEPDA